jgi:hypothetical protein
MKWFLNYHYIPKLFITRWLYMASDENDSGKRNKSHKKSAIALV